MQPVRVALLSFGMSGRVFHAPFIDLNPGFQLLGSWERSKRIIQEHYPRVKSYPSLESVLEDRLVDLVIVNTPTSTHYEYARKALEAGKHVVVEKAFTTTVAEAVELKTLAERNKLKLSVFQNRRWDSDFKTVRQVVESGNLGNLVEVDFSYDRYNPLLSPKVHKETPGPGSGILKDLGPHLIDQALVLFGLPTSIFATIKTTRALSKVDDYFEIMLFYRTLRVRLKASYFVREPVPSFVLHGTNGSFLKARADVQEVDLQKGEKPDRLNWGVEPDQAHGLLHTTVDGKTVRETVKSLPGNYSDYYVGIYQSIEQNLEPPVTAEEGIRVMQIIEAAEKSKREKRVVELG
jgi:predicted dehydrogenase